MRPSPLWMKIVAIAILLAMAWFMVVQPSMECYADGGTPVRGIFIYECMDRMKS